MENKDGKKEDTPSTPKEESKEESVDLTATAESKEKQLEKPKPLDDEDADDEISIDFSKVKSMFKGKDKPKEEAKSEEKHSTEKKASDDSEDDDEISIDFSKIKKAFSSDEKEKKKESSQSKGEDDEITIDFSKVKNVFKKKSHVKEESEEVKDDEVNIDFGSIAGFFGKHGVIILLLLALIVPLFLSVHVRMQSSELAITDQWAQDSVINHMRNQIAAQVGQQYPNLPQANRDAIIGAELQNQLDTQWPAIRGQIDQISLQYKDHFKNPEGIPYMPDIDTYYWMRYAQNILDTGKPADTERDGRPWDSHQLAPNGRPIFPDMWPAYFIAYWHSFVTLFAPNLSLIHTMSFYPVLIATLSTLLVFLIGRKITNNIGGFFAAVIFTVNSSLIGRTLYGHADSDAWVIFFPLLVTWLFFEIFDRQKKRSAMILGGLAGAVVGLFSFSWIGWWYIFDFILIMVFAHLFIMVVTNYKVIQEKKIEFFKQKDILNVVLGTVVYFCTAMVVVSMVLSPAQFFDGILGPIGFTSIKSPVSPNLWPNVLTTVAELNPGSVNEAVNSVGGKVYFFMSLLGILLILMRFNVVNVAIAVVSALYFAIVLGAVGKSNNAFYFLASSDIQFLTAIMVPFVVAIGYNLFTKGPQKNTKFAIILLLWYASSIFAVSKGIRFTLLLAPAFAVAFGCLSGVSYQFFSRWLSKELHIPKAIIALVIIVIFMLPLIAPETVGDGPVRINKGPIKQAYEIGQRDLPLVNDVWYNSLTAIKVNSSEDAIITSWWDFGHHFKQIADRPVTFDGTTQTHTPARWVGKLFMTSNERESIGILRMLDCGNGDAFFELDKVVQDTVHSVNILDKMILMEKEDAATLLRSEGLNDDQTSRILELTHCSPPEGFAIASQDMIGKSGVWAHFGSWNFVRADLWFNVRKQSLEEAAQYMQDRYNFTREEAENTYFEMQAITNDQEANAWVAPWPGYGGTTACERRTEHTFVCQNGFTLNYTTKDVFAFQNNQRVRPSKVAFVTREGVEVVHMQSDDFAQTIDAGMTFYPATASSFNAIVSSGALAGSIFTQMFYLHGHGLEHFEPFYEERGLIGTEIYVYKARWDQPQKRIYSPYVSALDRIEGVETPEESAGAQEAEGEEADQEQDRQAIIDQLQQRIEGNTQDQEAQT